jgi:hypothetical protein
MESNVKRYEIILYLINKYDYKSYLEIGVQKGVTFERIPIKKVGVDPMPQYESPNIVRRTSDTFFKENKEKFDIIFIDGLHLSEQVLKDITNSLEVLNEKGIILVHDCNPLVKEEANRLRTTKRWNGDVWKGFIRARCLGYKSGCINEDEGIGWITLQKEQIEIPSISWDEFVLNRKKYLNLMSYNEFKSSIFS